MIRKNLKLLFTIFIIVIMSFSVSPFSKATDVEVISETSEATVSEGESSTPATEEEPEIYSGDLYLFDTKVVMDKLVDGNVFICGQEVEISGQVNGDLFVCANKLTFTNTSYVRYSVYAVANSIYYDGACNDLYVASNNIEMTYNSYVVRDVKSLSSSMKFKAAIGRDADLSFNKIELGEGEDIPIVYGNLRYYAPAEVTLPEGVITENGSVTYTKQSELAGTSTISTIMNILLEFATCIVTVLIIYVVTKKFTPNFSEKISNKKLSVTKILKLFGIGLLSLVIVSILSILLLITSVGTKLAFILIMLFSLLCLIAIPALSIIITNALKPAFKIEKTSMFCLILILVSIVLHGITLIPYVGGIIGLLIKLLGIGLIIDIYIPHKELTDEEKSIIEEKKKKIKEEKEKRKQEKLEAKAAKKKEKDDNSTL